MKLKQIFEKNSERAVSPVIGVILMVAITVILASVIGVFVIGLGDGLQEDGSAPILTAEASTASSYVASDGTGSGDILYMTHQTGDSIAVDDSEFIVRNSDGGEIARFSGSDWSADVDGTTGISLELNGEEPGTNDETSFSSGATFTLIHDDGDISGTDLNNGEEISVQLVHQPSGSTVVDRDLTLAS